MTIASSHPDRSRLHVLRPEVRQADRRNSQRSAALSRAAHPAARLPMLVPAQLDGIGASGTGPPDAELSGAPAHRRRQGWFEMNPGCFARAALATSVAGAVAGGISVWLGRRVWRSSPVRAARRALRVYRAVRHPWSHLRSGRRPARPRR